VAALLLAPGAALDPPEAMPSAAALAALAALAVLGLVCTAAGLLVYGMLVAEAGAGRALVITYVNPVVAVALGMVLLGERPGPGALVAGSWLATASRSEAQPARRHQCRRSGFPRKLERCWRQSRHSRCDFASAKDPLTAGTPVRTFGVADNVITRGGQSVRSRGVPPWVNARRLGTWRPRRG
jgi:EamA-like transporter family